jgi:hypothetical protein
MKHQQLVMSDCTAQGSWATAGEGNVAAPSWAYLRHPVALSQREKTAAVARVRWLEHELFDGDGHVRRRVSREHATAIVDELNQLRATLGWLEIDLEGHWRWP